MASKSELPMIVGAYWKVHKTGSSLDLARLNFLSSYITKIAVDVSLADLVFEF